jgi:hypothetical protein
MRDFARIRGYPAPRILAPFLSRADSSIIAALMSRPRTRLLALILALAPGWGHVYWGRQTLGLLLFTLFVVGGFAALNGLILHVGPGGSWLVRVSVLLTALVLVWNWVDILLRTAGGRARREDEERDRRLRDGMITYLRGDYPTAKSLFEACVHADPLDADALFRLGMTYVRSGEPRRAIAWLRRARRRDTEEKWSWEVREELARLKRPSPSSAGESRKAAPTSSERSKADKDRAATRHGDV